MNVIPFPEIKAAFDEDPASLLWKVPGIFLVHKPTGMTSHDVVSRARRQLGLRRVGHGGTLDPMASGLLLILAGNATRLFDSLQVFDKEYQSAFRLGARTDTQDATGSVTEEGAENSLPVLQESIEKLLPAFRGEIMQIPPMYSALKKNGRKLVDLAREGKTVERDPRPVRVDHLTLDAFDGIDGQLTMSVSKGFYVRTLIDDIGAALGTFAHMTSLVRTRTGPFTLADAVGVDAIGEANAAGGATR